MMMFVRDVETLQRFEVLSSVESLRFGRENVLMTVRFSDETDASRPHEVPYVGTPFNVWRYSYVLTDESGVDEEVRKDLFRNCL